MYLHMLWLLKTFGGVFIDSHTSLGLVLGKHIFKFFPMHFIALLTDLLYGAESFLIS
jgi:hypothetical protein